MQKIFLRPMPFMGEGIVKMASEFSIYKYRFGLIEAVLSETFTSSSIDQTYPVLLLCL